MVSCKKKWSDFPLRMRRRQECPLFTSLLQQNTKSSVHCNKEEKEKAQRLERKKLSDFSADHISIENLKEPRKQTS